MTASRSLLLAALIAAGCVVHQPPPEQDPVPEGPARQDTAPQEAARPTPPAGQSVPTLPSRADSRHCLALAMYWEARGEGHDGMAAVGAVVLNRVAHSRFPDTPCDVVHQGGETPPCQFSWWCDGRSDRPTHRRLWASALALADEMLAHRTSDPTNGALFFHSASIASPWRRVQTAQIGNHVFYR